MRRGLRRLLPAPQNHPSQLVSGLPLLSRRCPAQQLTTTATTNHRVVIPIRGRPLMEISPTPIFDTDLVTAPSLGDPHRDDPLGASSRPEEVDPWPSPYYREGYVRRVAPYYFQYNTFCKERWRGRTLFDVFEKEFRDKAPEYYRAAMEAGTVAVNATTVGPDYVLKDGDVISHNAHRHEPAVTAEPIRIIHEDDQMMVIVKPSGIPVHPAGRYHHNSVCSLLRAARGPDFVPRPCNRLDRLTSGIMFIAKDAAAAGSLGKQIFARSVRKEYIARVNGRFPDGDTICDQPILQISPKLGLNRVRANGKNATTFFKRLAYYEAAPVRSSAANTPSPHPPSGYSIVRCLPVTGRTHQIRVHLQFLGHPIQNDPIYANARVWGHTLGFADADGAQTSDEDVIARLSRMGKDQVAQAVAYYDEMVEEYEKKRAERLSGEACAVCKTPLYTDPSLQELSLWLHSVCYEDAAGAWRYASPLPAWALPPGESSAPLRADAGVSEVVEAAQGLVLDDAETPPLPLTTATITLPPLAVAAAAIASP